MIKIIKLITAEEILGDMTIEDEVLKIKEPCAIIMIPSQSSVNQHSMALMPYAGYTKNHRIEVNMNKIVWIAEPAEEVYNQYNKIFGTGIQIVV